MKKWNKLIVLGMISVVLAAQAAGCGSKKEEELTYFEMLDRDKEMQQQALRDCPCKQTAFIGCADRVC